MVDCRVAIAKRGFTIVELIVVIVIIAMLAAMAVVSYNGIQRRSRNTTIVAAAQESYKLLTMYSSRYAAFPYMSDGNLCMTLDRRCTNYDTSTLDGQDNSALINELKKVGTPVGVQPQTSGPGRGVLYNAWNDNARTAGGTKSPVHMLYWLDGKNQDCGMAVVSKSAVGNAQTVCEVEIPLAG